MGLGVVGFGSSSGGVCIVVVSEVRHSGIWFLVFGFLESDELVRHRSVVEMVAFFLSYDS